MIVSNVKDYLTGFYRFQPKSESWYAGSVPVIDSEGDENQEIITPLNSSWVDFVQYNIGAQIATIYFDVFATNGKEPVVLLGPDAIEKAKGLISAGSPGQYYLNNIARGSGGVLTSLFSLVEDAVRDLGKDLIPNVVIKFISKSKRFLNVLKTPVIAVGRYVGTQTSKILGGLVGANVLPAGISRVIILKYYSTFEKHFLKAVQTNGRIANSKYLSKIFQQKFEKLLPKVLSNAKLQTESFAYANVLKGGLEGATIKASSQTFITLISKILSWISLAALVVVLPLQIGLQVSNDLKALKREENRLKKVNSLDKREDIDFMRKITKLKVNLALASSLTPASAINRAKSRAKITIKNAPGNPYKDIEGKFDGKIREVRNNIYKDNKGLTKIKSLKEQGTTTRSNVRTTRQAPKRITNRVRQVRR